MYFHIFLSIIHGAVVLSTPRDSKWEKNTQINKNVWKKHPENLAGEFVFRPNSVDVENVMNNDYYMFGSNEQPSFNSYVERSRRSLKNMKRSSDRNVAKTNIKDQQDFSVKAELLSKFRPLTVLDDYPNEVTLLLGKKDDEIRLTFVPNEKIVVIEDNDKESAANSANEFLKAYHLADIEDEGINETESNKTLPLANDVAKDRRYIASTSTTWLPTKNDVSFEQNKYKVYPLQDNDFRKEAKISEKVLLKIFSVLNKTLVKITRHHKNITEIQKNMTKINKEFYSTINKFAAKIREFETKYKVLQDIIKELFKFDGKMTAKEKEFKEKEKLLIKHCNDFENQQKQFLAQQRQFYNIQKSILSQNEKITRKQSQIAKTQHGYAEQQNILNVLFENARRAKINNPNKQEEPITYSSTPEPVTSVVEIIKQSTEPVKIDLLTMPLSTAIPNNDAIILREKDNELIDDLVYKYYFNNTLIENLMKAKVFAANVVNNREATRKNKRMEETTILLPVSKKFNFNRQKRWIRHELPNDRKPTAKIYPVRINKGFNPYSHDKKKVRSINKVHVSKTTTARPLFPIIPRHLAPAPIQSFQLDPFFKMASSFCDEIGQNKDSQMLGWCIEKALRRLQFMADTKPIITERAPTASPSPRSFKPYKKPNKPRRTFVHDEIKTTSPSVPTPIYEKPEELTVSASTRSSQSPMASLSTAGTQMTTKNIYFPDNDELETNLKDYEMKPNPEGNIYYDDSSLHASDIIVSDSDMMSELMPGMESNSKMDIDPNTLNLHEKRRAVVQRINAKILNNFSKNGNRLRKYKA